MPQFDVVCVGNAKIDIFLTLHEATNHLRVLEKTNELCVRFGDKVNVDKAEIVPGGNAANVSVGISRFGLNTALVAEIGKDEFAQKIINALLRENVNTQRVAQTEGQQSSFSTIISFKGERTIFSEHVKRKHNFSFEDVSTKWIYLTSLGEDWQSAYSKTLDFAKEKQCLLAFNPGKLQIKGSKKDLENVLLATNLLFVNKEEAEEILNINSAMQNQTSNINELLKKMQRLGPKTVVITDGKNGSFAIDQKGNLFKKGIIEVPVVEKTGAGDAYSSGFLSALINNGSIDNAMEWGTKNSAAVISKIGAQNGLLQK